MMWIVPALLAAGGEAVITKDSLVPIGVAGGLIVSALILGMKIQKLIDAIKTLADRVGGVESKVNKLYCVQHPDWAEKMERAAVEQKGHK